MQCRNLATIWILNVKQSAVKKKVLEVCTSSSPAASARCFPVGPSPFLLPHLFLESKTLLSRSSSSPKTCQILEFRRRHISWPCAKSNTWVSTLQWTASECTSFTLWRTNLYRIVLSQMVHLQEKMMKVCCWSLQNISELADAMLRRCYVTNMSMSDVPHSVS